MPGAEPSIPAQQTLADRHGDGGDAGVCADEWHIAGVLVQAWPERVDAVRVAIAAVTGAEIHAASAAGKLVVTLEAPSSRAIAAHLAWLQQVEGVLAATLVYQHNEDLCNMHEGIVDDTHPQGLY